MTSFQFFFDLATIGALVAMITGMVFTFETWRYQLFLQSGGDVEEKNTLSQNRRVFWAKVSWLFFGCLAFLAFCIWQSGVLSALSN